MALGVAAAVAEPPGQSNGGAAAVPAAAGAVEGDEEDRARGVAAAVIGTAPQGAVEPTPGGAPRTTGRRDGARLDGKKRGGADTDGRCAEGDGGSNV